MIVDLQSPIAPAVAVDRLTQQGFATLTPEALAQLAGLSLAQLDALHPHWAALPPDRHLKDGGRYRHRRHGCYVQTLPQNLARCDLSALSAGLQATPHRAHWQPTTYNALHGGMERWFDPLEPGLVANPSWSTLIAAIGGLFAQRRAPEDGRWWIETHPFRIDTRDGVGRPTPEGAHRDGVDFVAVLLVERHAVIGGETRVFEAGGPGGVRFTLQRPWSALLLDDARVVHESTPIQPADAHGQPLPPEAVAREGHRDTLVLTYRSGGFQSPGGR